MDIENIEEFITIEKRIDIAEDQIAECGRESIRDRWEFGRLMLAQRKGKQVPNGMLTELGAATGKSRAELQFRMRFAERYRTEDEVCNALRTCASWRQVIKSLPKTGDAQPSSLPSAPQQHAKHAEVIALKERGMTCRAIAKQTGVGERQIRHIVEREQVEQKAKAEAVAVDWNTLPGSMKTKAEAMRRQIRKELESEIGARVRTEVQSQIAWERKLTQQMQDQARRILDARRNGIISRADYDLIRSCLHPDSRISVTDAKLAQAFRVFNESEILFLSEKDCPATTLPSMADLLKKRRA